MKKYEGALKITRRSDIRTQRLIPDSICQPHPLDSPVSPLSNSPEILLDVNGV